MILFRKRCYCLVVFLTLIIISNITFAESIVLPELIDTIKENPANSDVKRSNSETNGPGNPDNKTSTKTQENKETPKSPNSTSLPALREKSALQKNTEGTVAVIPLDMDNLQAVKEFLRDWMPLYKGGAVSAVVFSPAGSTPRIVISGNPTDVDAVVKILADIVPQKAQKHLVVILATLREISESDGRTIGLNLIPTVNATSVSQFYLPSGVNGNKNITTTAIEGSLSNIASLNEVLSRSKVLVSSEVFTPDGIKASINNVQRVPVFTVDRNSNVSTEFQELETSITVIPTILEYHPEKSDSSLVRVDVTVKISVITGERAARGVSAPESSIKTMNTTRVFKADNQMNIVGSFVSDSTIKSVDGIPLLSKIPVLGSLFSRSTNQKRRNTAMLTLMVRLVPVRPNTVVVSEE